MRKIPLLVALLFLACAMSAQTNTPSPKVKAAFQEKLERLSNEELDYLNFVAERGYVVHEANKQGANQPLLSAHLKPGHEGAERTYAADPASINPFAVDGERSEHQFYQIDGTGRVLQVYSDAYCRILYRDFVNNRKNHPAKH